MKRGKAQYSIEFLITYGWALLILGIIVAAIYTFGWFNPESILPQDCTFYGQVGCKDFYLSEESFNLSLVNNFGENLYINGINIENEGSNCVLEYPSNIEWKRNNFAIVGFRLTDGSGSCSEIRDTLVKGSRVKMKTTIYYFFNETCNECYGEGYLDSDCSSCVHQSVGDVVVRVN